MWTDPGSTPPQYPLDQLVLVHLDLVFGPPPADVEPNPDGRLADGLVLTGTVPGRVRKWGRAADGRRVGLVDFTICDRDSATVARHQWAVVLAEALTEVELPPRR